MNLRNFCTNFSQSTCHYTVNPDSFCLHNDNKNIIYIQLNPLYSVQHNACFCEDALAANFSVGIEIKILVKNWRQQIQLTMHWSHLIQRHFCMTLY